MNRRNHIENPRWYPARKKADEFCAKHLPWKATNGYVCIDCYTESEAIEAADEQNKERKIT